MISSSEGSIVRRFQDLRVAVIGDAILDRFVECHGRKLCTEAPVPVVRREREVRVPGGAANVAANLAALGARVSLVAVTGADEAGGWLRTELEARGVDVGLVLADPSFRTHQKTRIIADGQYVVRLDEGECAPAARLRRAVDASVAAADAVLLSDYALGMLDARLVARLARGGISAPVIVDAKRPTRFRRVRPTAVTPNLDEARALAGDAFELEALARRVRRETGAAVVALTLGSRGAYLLSGEGPGELVPARPARSESEVGAGDSFVAALALSLAAGASPLEATTVAVEAAGIAVAKRHTAVVQAEELARSLALAEVSGSSATREAAELTTLMPALEERKRRGQRLVFTNGVFDLLHTGHVDLLRRARRLGDALVVAVNSDTSVRQLKGPGRPIATEAERVSLLAALDCVDHVLVFDARTAAGLLRRVRPDVYVKGGDYAEDDLPEAEVARQLGTQVVILPRTLPASTTSLIRRVRELSGRGAQASTA